MPTNYKTNQIMYWGAEKVTDHNRAPLAESYELIERKMRAVDGTLRKYVRTPKKNWSTSWENLPSHNNLAGSGTVDSGMSGEQMQAFYLSNINKAFTMKLKDGSGAESTYTVMINEFSRDIVKRGAVDLWNASVTLEEV